jgi:hypothetical protein
MWRRIRQPRSVALVCAALLIAVCGCRSATKPDRSRLHSEYAFDRAAAAVDAAERGDAVAIHRLVDLLEDDDPGVRFFAIAALERLCGTSAGFRYHDDAETRARAVNRWRDGLLQGTIALRSSATSGPTGRRLDVLPSPGDAASPIADGGSERNLGGRSAGVSPATMAGKP